eukprot:1186129-Prorocentrum_minimum.AAC.2
MPPTEGTSGPACGPHPKCDMMHPPPLQRPTPKCDTMPPPPLQRPTSSQAPNRSKVSTFLLFCCAEEKPLDPNKTQRADLRCQGRDTLLTVPLPPSTTNSSRGTPKSGGEGAKEGHADASGGDLCVDYDCDCLILGRGPPARSTTRGRAPGTSSAALRGCAPAPPRCIGMARPQTRDPERGGAGGVGGRAARRTQSAVVVNE